MSLRAPQRESLARLHAIAEAVDFKRSSLDFAKEAAQSRAGVENIEFDTEFPSFCFPEVKKIPPRSTGQVRLRGRKIESCSKSSQMNPFFRKWSVG